MDILCCPLSVAVVKLLPHAMAGEATAKGSVKSVIISQFFKGMPVSILTIKPHLFPYFNFSQLVSKPLDVSKMQL
jgi:hypothetical protein